VKVTDEMVEAALAAYHGPIDKSIARDCAVFMRAAIEAALEALPKTGEWKWNKENEND